MKRVKTICFWTFNILLIVGLLAISVAAYIKGDTYHTILNLLYFLIILSNFAFRVLNRRLKQENESLYEGGKVLVEQNAKLTRKLTEMQDPFRYNPMIQINGQHVRMEILRSTTKREKSFLTGFDEMERNRRLHYMETVAKQDLMESIFDTELVEIRQNFDAIHEDTVTAEIIVGVKSDKPIDEIIKS
jgi:hypothetical protein